MSWPIWPQLWLPQNLLAEKSSALKTLMDTCIRNRNPCQMLIVEVSLRLDQAFTLRIILALLQKFCCHSNTMSAQKAFHPQSSSRVAGGEERLGSFARDENRPRHSSLQRSFDCCSIWCRLFTSFGNHNSCWEGVLCQGSICTFYSNFDHVRRTNLQQPSSKSKLWTKVQVLWNRDWITWER